MMELKKNKPLELFNVSSFMLVCCNKRIKVFVQLKLMLRVFIKYERIRREKLMKSRFTRSASQSEVITKLINGCLATMLSLILLIAYRNRNNLLQIPL